MTDIEATTLLKQRMHALRGYVSSVITFFDLDCLETTSEEDREELKTTAREYANKTLNEIERISTLLRNFKMRSE